MPGARRSVSSARGLATATGRAHQLAVARLLASYRAVPATATVRLAKKTSNLFRVRRPTAVPGLDVTGLAGVLSIDPAARTADVAGMCTYETLVAATLPHGLSPLVVPQLKTITVGGAVTGLGIESASFRNGLVHESVLEMDILTGAGEMVTASPDNEHADLLFGFPNSFGTLGYATRIRIQLESVEPYVALRHLRFTDLDRLTATVDDIVATGAHDGIGVDYLDGVVFTADECYLTLGLQTADPGPTSDYTRQQIYYRSIRERTTDRLTINDYLWRWDTDWFWCSRAFGVQQPVVRRLWPRRLRRSSFYWKLVALERKYGIADRIEKLHSRPPLERVVQDVEIPLEGTADFLAWFLDTVPIEPLWLCPLRTRPTSGQGAPRQWPLYPLGADRTYVNIGFWSVVPSRPGGPAGATNRLIEDRVTESHGHKSLYSDAFYTHEDFDRLYGGTRYAELKETYDPESRLLDLYAKVVGRR